MRKKDPCKREELLEKCFDCFCRHGIEGTSTRMLSEACGMSAGNIFHYFKSKDEIIIEATAHCMAKVEDEFMANAPRDMADVQRFLKDIPYWTAQRHGEKYRFMYQVYTSPKYRRYGTEFFSGVTRRYAAYAKVLEERLGIPGQIIQALIYTFVRASVHYALFEDEAYLLPQLRLLEAAVPMFREKYAKAPPQDPEDPDRQSSPPLPNGEGEK